ncbi:MAG: Serine hydroxymethyltransferase [Candidatus Falkowbacteria bacterium GW2011_GWF2_39_8]|uniref:Serine hydroxymethyltransferase n=1 Tax=Candidatus Falkowbacteria bacterium GW2011_GWF2_39_8 TaxID=1618642 RepID=A0A0G0PXA8_9BACT|nr:MAG: Serine hydroxymethyltransferase [Candidatus Falkowbacteria bacterium GW2011_GWF2_39_8]
MEAERVRQQEGIELIASENYVSVAVQEALGSIFTNKYSEGYSGKRYYAGNEFVDDVENLAISRAKELFGAEHVNVQPLSGSPANAAVYFATVKPGDKILGLKLDHGGHLSHGHPVNFSGMLYDFVQYTVKKETGEIDMDEVREIALREKPKMILAGFSAYSRNMDWKRFKEIADEVGAITFADIAHIAGLIAGKQIESPVPYFDIVTTTTHKTLRGPRGAMIMCKEKFAKDIDRAVFPGMQGGPHDNNTAAKAIAFGEALKPEFQAYAKQVILNAKAMADELMKNGFKIISDGTDNHLMVVDLSNQGLVGKEAEVALDKAGISTSRSTIPYDINPPMNPSGIRLGTPAVTTRGMKEAEMRQIAQWIIEALKNKDDDNKLEAIRQEVKSLCAKYPIPTF